MPCHFLFQGGEIVNACLAVVVRPAASASVGVVVSVDDLQACPKRQFFRYLTPAPAGDFGDAVNVGREPAGAV
jgi:hypothetical protein